ncbi:sigma-70 family RNA polymerase sigma factor [Algibacillus agarilyticus]|uniref:sigma-70 family RNA polymerase sigma factor n=1 Tax=Algibacillus agarilyticus TaxID=2234133 RepID=UPI000DCFC073|nr:sigma-70 family RNA polymerase sigma factor [Algibacillus agarilyticus]
MSANPLNKSIANETNSALQNRSAVFVELFEADRSRLYAYIYAYVMDNAAADDIFQETSMTLWREFHKFEIGTQFSKWANGIAFNRVLVFRRTNKKYTLGLSDELIMSMSATIDKNSENSLVNKWAYLQDCRALLPPNDQQLYDRFYIKNLKAQAIADQTARSIFAIRKSIHKLRKKLFDCVDRKKHKEQL